MKPRHLILTALFATLACIILASARRDDPSHYHGLRIVSSAEAATVVGGGPTIVCPGRICNDIKTGKCIVGTVADACQGVTCTYRHQETGTGRVRIEIHTCEVSFNQEVCREPTEENYECTESHAVNDDECTLSGFDSHCGWKVINNCHIPKFVNGAWGCPLGCFTKVEVGQYCGEGCFPFLM